MADNQPSMPDLAEFLVKTRTLVDAVLDEIVPAGTVPPTRLHSAIRWSLFAGGKRLRPALLFAAGRTFGASDEALVQTAAAIELIHTYSLIHDDLPSMDNDDLRRGRPTCHKQFDEATAILAGDVMQTLAFQTMANDKLLDGPTRLRLITLIAAAAGTPAGMVSGQQLDLDAEGSDVALDDLENIHRQKTGALITAAATAGAMIGGATGSELVAVEEYGRALGLLFQVTDDLLDVTQATETLGKTAGKDADARKATYAAILGIDESRRLAGELVDTAKTALSSLSRDTILLAALVDRVVNRTS